MQDTLELRLELPVIAPDKPWDVSRHVKEAIEKAVAETGLDDVIVRREPVTFEQRLPTKEQVELVIAVATFVLHEAPVAWPHIKNFLDLLAGHLQRTPAFSVKVVWGEGKVSAKLKPGDTMKVITDELEIIVRSPAKG